VPEPRLLHPLALDVKCPACGAGLRFIRVRRYGDLYQCSGGPCKRQVLHYRNKGTKACGYAPAYGSGKYGAWTACGDKPRAEGGVRGRGLWQQPGNNACRLAPSTGVCFSGLPSAARLPEAASSYRDGGWSPPKKPAQEEH
jgi:hypothetical protein